MDGVGLKIWVYSIKEIKKGEELTYDYGFSFDSDYKKLLITLKNFLKKEFTRLEDQDRMNFKLKRQQKKLSHLKIQL